MSSENPALNGARARLGSMQTDVARALIRGEDDSLSISPRSMDRVRAALIGKRRSTAAQAWPDLAKALGTEYAPLFTDYANEHPLPADASSISDGRQFAQWLGDRLPLEAVLPVMQFDLFYAAHGGMLMRRGCMARMIRLRHGLCAGFRIPGLFQHCFLIRYPHRRAELQAWCAE